MNALNAAPVELPPCWAGGGGGGGGGGAVEAFGFGFGTGGPAAFGLTAGSLLCPGGVLATVAYRPQIVHAHLMWVYILIPTVFAFLLGWACAESRLEAKRHYHRD
jgi:hypothetical protein